MLAEANIPVGVMVAPIIPGLTDHEAPAILKEAKANGAKAAGYTLLRLPLTVEPVFREWLHREQPTKAEKVESLIRKARGGHLNESQWGQRMRGTGEIAEQIQSMFQVFRQKLGFESLPELDTTQFQVPKPKSGQLTLF
jgi:DNA repair photolyase